MEIIGLICEYNPFHNGHIYHIKKIKQLYPHSLLILCLNGYFLERGEISLLSKEAKTSLALEYGIDLVVELPTIYGCQSADNFAYAAITILNSLNVTKIIFGSEKNDINALLSIAKKQKNISNQTLKNELAKGNNYPQSLINSLNINHISPNDLLGISYCKTILNNNYPITLETIKRTNSYHDKTSTKKIISASNIREKYQNKENITKYLPLKSLTQINQINTQKYFDILKHQIITNQNLNQILDVNEGIEYLLYKKVLTCHSLKDFLNQIKSKRYTFNRLNRMLIHIFLGYQKEYTKAPLTYIHVLGFNEHGQKYLKDNRHNFLLPTKVNHNSLIYQFEYQASILYDLLTNNHAQEFELNNKPIYKNTASLVKLSSQK